MKDQRKSHWERSINSRKSFPVLLNNILLVSAILLAGILSIGFGQSFAYPFTIVSVGDWDCNAETEKTIANIQKQNPDIILSLGDMSYKSSATCWLDLIEPIKNKMMIVQGNHDDNFDDYMKAFGMSEPWTAKGIPEANALFIGLNTEESLSANSNQLKFADKMLSESNAAWKITFMHKPSITYGHHPSDEGSPETLLPLYDKTKTSIEFSGHNHFMQEIYPTTSGNGEPKKVAAGEGTVHIVSGGGGRDLYDYESNEVVAQSKAEHGIVKTVLLSDKDATSEFIANNGQVTKMSDIINRNYKGTTEPPVVTPPTEPTEPSSTNQILITSNIQKTEQKGEFTSQDYLETYNVRNLFDNLTNSWSFWSQYGVSGFKVDLEKPLTKELCTVDIEAYNPQNQKYTLNMFDSNNNKLVGYSNNLKASNTEVNIQGCVKNVDKISMDFDNAGKWVTMSEVRLFSNSSSITPPIEPPQCPEGWHYDIALRKCIEDPVEPPIEPPTEPPVIETPVTNGTLNIVNGTATIKALNSNIVIVLYTDDMITEWNMTEINMTEILQNRTAGIDSSIIQYSSGGSE